MKAWLFLFSLLTVSRLFSAPVDTETSQKLAEKFIASMPHIYDASYRITGTETIEENGTVLFRVYHLSPSGFIVISADDRLYPVPAFSGDGVYSGREMPGMKIFLNKWKKEAIHTFNTQSSPSPETSVLWENLNQGRYALGTSKPSRSVEPLLTTQWNQDYPYNIACPPDAAGSGGYTYAGCVATAMGQLMFYHRWPLTGTGTFSYDHSVYGTLSADFGNTTYEWNAMPNRVLAENQAVALLLHHLGVGVSMDYGPNGSGMWNHSADRVMRDHFRYCPETRYIFRDSTTLNWDSLVVTNLDARKPLYYAGWEDTTYTMGHAFVCDGYETNDYYHFNWGWGGSYDGYFHTGQMNPGGANFNFCQELIVDIYPDTLTNTYPLFCQGPTEINDITGTITDGSGLHSYPSGSNCSWWLNPDCGILPELSFDAFDLATGDTLFVFEGTPSQHYLKQFFTIDQPPLLNSSLTPTLLRTDSSTFYIEFLSTGQADGFIASYNTIFCLSNDTLSNDEGTIEDGSRECNYRKSTNCRWLLEVPGAQIYHFTTEEFGMYSGSTAHSLQIYKESISSANLAYKFTSAETPPASFTIEATKLHFRFLTTSTGTDAGWIFNYKATPLSANRSESDPGIYIYPNPATAESVIFTGDLKGPYHMELYDISGKCLAQVNVNGTSGSLSISDYIALPQAGFYVLKISGSNGMGTMRLLVD